MTKNYANEWIKGCSGCTDSSASPSPMKQCNFCVRNPFAPAGEDKLDFYTHFTKKEERGILVAKYNEAKKQKFLEQQAQRQVKQKVQN